MSIYIHSYFSIYTYTYITEKITIGFASTVGTKKRISWHIIMLPTSISMAKNFLMMIPGDVHSFRGEVLRLLRPLQVLA